jgi:hypothetical protein
MFQQNSLARLYPHLNFSRVDNPSRSRSEPPINTPRPQTVEKKPEITEKTVEKPKSPTKEKTPEKPKKKKSPKKKSPTKKVEIKEPSPVKNTPTEQPINKSTRPNRVKPEPKPKPKRESQIPSKGERGLQRKYTQEQRRQIYLDRLSRKSIKNAEKEVAEVNKVLDGVENNYQKLLEEEREVKRKLKLINYAKFFSLDNISENEQNSIEPKESLSENLSNEPQGLSLQSGRTSQTPTGKNRGDRNGKGRTTSSKLNDKHNNGGRREKGNSKSVNDDSNTASSSSPEDNSSTEDSGND